MMDDEPKRSPFDVEDRETTIKTEEILDFITQGRRFAEFDASAKTGSWILPDTYRDSRRLP